MNEIQGSVITDDGVRLAYKTVGEGPRNLLLLHGWGRVCEQLERVYQSPRSWKIPGYCL